MLAFGMFLRHGSFFFLAQPASPIPINDLCPTTGCHFSSLLQRNH